ncbi:MAG: MG2 domain-containing protein, partial [Polyangiaceae bacterium]|nr:MG2 domain-containing protein [Polyangiaceae bacterium]
MIHKPSQKSGRVLIPITKLAHLALAILVMSSCFYRETAPNVPHKSTLEPDDPGAAPSDQPLSVVFASPQGETTESPEISILFNRPMRTLDLSDAETPSPAILSPNTWGAWHWVGTQGLYFSPQTRLPLATEMVVSVPAGTSALDGTALSEPYVFRFNTARPSLVDVIPSDRASHLVPSSSFFLKFNQSIADSEIAQAIKITTSSEPVHSIPFAIMPRLLNKLNSARIVPTEPLPLAAKILITADESLRGMEGPLTAAKQAVFEYATIGPLRVVDYYCGINKQNKVCAPDSTVHIRLSNQVLTLEARQSLSVSPSTLLKEEKQYGEFPESVTDQIRIEGSFLPAKTYRFKIKGSLRDIYGQPMGKDEVVMVRFADLPSRVQIGVSLPYSSVDRIFMERGSIRDIPVTYTNAGDMELLTVRLAEDELGLLTDLDDIDFDRISTMSGVMPVHVEHPPDPNRTATHLIRPSDVLGGRDKRGPLLIAARYTSHGTYRNGEVDTDRRIVQVTDLGISTKISSYGSLVWITRLSDGKPVEGAEVRIRAAGGSASTDQVYRTDSNGIAIVDDAVLRVPAHGTVGPMIIAKHGQDWGYKAASDVQVSYYDDIPRVFGADVSPIGMVFTDRGIYGPGDTVKIKAILRDARSQDAVTLANKSTRVTVTGRRHKTLAIRDVKLSQFGTLALDFKVPENAALGKFNISVSVGGIDQSDASASFEVAEYRPSEFKVTTEFDRHLYIRGDTAKCTTHGRLLVGSPMGGARASMTVRRELVHFRVPNTVGFFTEDYYSNSQRAWSGNAVLDHLPLGKNKLDSGGDASLNTRLMLPGMVSTESIRCAAEVSDFSRQTVASSGMAIVHPAEFYLGIRQRSAAFPLAGETIEPGIVAVDYEGRRRSGVVATIQLVQHTFVPGNTVPGNADLWRYVTDVTTVVDHCTVHTSAVVESCKMTVPAAGFYSIRAKAVDRRGNPVLASTYIYTTGSGTPYSRSNFRRDDRLELVPDRDLYEVGDIANITVHSPFP